MATVAPLIVITGPTASGKTGLALELAEKWGGEIICADSRTIYKGMDIGTAKPTKEEQALVPHRGIDVVKPDERFTVVDFQHMAQDAIRDIRSRGKIPFLVGGTGLYIDAVVLQYVFGPDVDFNRRAELEKLSVAELTSLHQKQQMLLPENKNNKRYLIRNIEKYNISTSSNTTPEEGTHVFALVVDRADLRARIQQRIEVMFRDNIVFETQQLLDMYGKNNEAMTGNIYRIVGQLIAGDIDESEAKRLCATRDWQLAKRQMTWLRRHEYVQWLDSSTMRTAIETILQNFRDA